MKRAVLLVCLVLAALYLSGCTQEQEAPDQNVAPPTAGPSTTPAEPLGEFSLDAQPNYLQLIGEIKGKVLEGINEKRHESYCPALIWKSDLSDNLVVNGENVYTVNLRDEYDKWASADEAAAKIIETAAGDEKNKKNLLECGFSESSIEAELNSRGDRIAVTQKFAGKYSTACFDENSSKCSLDSGNYYAIVNEEFYCDVSHYATSLGVELKNHGTVAVPLGAIVRVILENKDSTYDYLRAAVEPGRKFWPDVKSIVRTPAFGGRTFSLSTASYGKELDLDYWMVYCYPGTKQGDCDRQTGRVIYQGNLLDCNAEVYAHPYTGIIIGASP